MSDADAPPGRLRRPERGALPRTVVAVALALTAALALAHGFAGDGEPPHAASDPLPRATMPFAPAVGRSAPVALSIPAIGVRTRVDPVGLNADQTVQVPTDFTKAGWFRLGPSHGQQGSAVILGHVDSYTGPALFYRLRMLRPRDRVTVTLTDGTVVRFAVDSVNTYANPDFPAQRVYGPHGGATLQLVTCGGPFDQRTHSYTANVVAWTHMVSSTAVPTSTQTGSRHRR